ncbi:MAG: right-handed parallel beta-helix repeat-containing protein [Planctomycetia bacterium]|nr:right-handed parallel beta-helix repeat-containing protein [Planctomycetia bacterium]
MRTRLSLGFAVLSALSALQLVAAGADFYVAPNGKDTNPGMAAAPFATVVKARDAVRQKIAAGLDHDIVVQIGGGTYPQTETLVFGPEDSGTEKHSITYAAAPGESAVLSGGRAIAGWRKGTGQIWTAELPDVKAGKWYFRQLFVNGRRAVRANTLNGNQWWNIQPQPGNVDANNATLTLGVDHPIQAWNNVADVEVIWTYNNDSTRKRLGAVNASNNTFTLPPPHNWAHGMPGEYNVAFPATATRCYFENAQEFLDQPGEWYLDRATGQLSYYPRPGEDMATAGVVAPVLQDTLLSVQGKAGQRVQNLIFQGITVAHVDRALPAAGQAGMFGCLEYYEEAGGAKKFRWLPAAVSFTNAQGCKFVDGAVEHVGGMGVNLLNGCTKLTIEGNAIRDLGGGGIAAGHIRNRDTHQWADPMGPNDADGLRIANNEISDCGSDYFGGIGVFAALMQNSVIAHNLIHDTAYSGIVLSGNEDPGSHAGNNTVEYNHIYNVMQKVWDGAGIYVSAPQDRSGALIRGNVIHDSGCAGVYFDGVGGKIPCINYHVEDNTAYKCHEAHVLLVFGSKATDSTWSNNRFMDVKDGVPPADVLAAALAKAGIDPAYARAHGGGKNK